VASFRQQNGFSIFEQSHLEIVQPRIPDAISKI